MRVRKEPKAHDGLWQQSGPADMENGLQIFSPMVLLTNPNSPTASLY